MKIKLYKYKTRYLFLYFKKIVHKIKNLVFIKNLI